MADAGARLEEEGNHDMCAGDWGKSENECISEEGLTESTICKHYIENWCWVGDAELPRVPNSRAQKRSPAMIYVFLWSWLAMERGKKLLSFEFLTRSLLISRLFASMVTEMRMAMGNLRGPCPH